MATVYAISQSSTRRIEGEAMNPMHTAPKDKTITALVDGVEVAVKWYPLWEDDMGQAGGWMSLETGKIVHATGWIK